MTAIELKGVAKHYPDFRLDHIDLCVPTGQIMGFIGPNGAGKSTTIRILMGLVRQDRGEVSVLGHLMPENQVLAKQQIGYVSEDLRLYRGATLAWHMEYIESIFPEWDQRYAQELLTRFDLKAEQKVKGMSHGQRVKSVLLLAFARRPKLLILDEPTTGLDPLARQEVLSGLADVLADEERTILFSSHNTQDVEQLSDCIAFIDQGRLIAADDKETFFDRWRRIRLQIPRETVLSVHKSQETVERSGNIAVVTTGAYSERLLDAYQADGAEILGVEHMTLEEIFLSNVSASRRRAV